MSQRDPAERLREILRILQDRWPDVRPALMVDPAGVKVGLIGVTTEDTLTTTIAANVRTLDNSGTAIHGIPASRILSIAFSSTFKQATPTIAST